MKGIIIIAIIAYAGYYFYTQQSSSCETMDDVKDRAYELSKAFIHASTAKNSGLSAESLMQKIKKLETMKNNEFPDITRACELMDELMDELDY